MDEIIPKKCCIKYKPPTLMLFYEVKLTGKLHRRSIPIRTSNDIINDDTINDLLKNSHHAKYLKEFHEEQIKKLLGMLSVKKSNFDLTPDKNSVDQLDIDKANLNKLDDEKLNEVKEIMNESFEQHQVKPGDAEWKYDVEVDFDKGKNVKIESGWDAEDDDSDMEF